MAVIWLLKFVLVRLGVEVRWNLADLVFEFTSLFAN